MGAGMLAPWRPLREFDHLFERMMDRMFREWPFAPDLDEPTRAHTTPLECFVQNGNLVVRADVPGIEPKDVDISLVGNVLTIKGERKGKEEVNKQDYLRREIAYGAFERRVTLPEGAQADKIKAEFRNGVIEITIPSAKEIAAKKIPLVEAK